METWILEQGGLLIYWAVFLGLLAGAIGLPFPEDLCLAIAGIAINRGLADVIPMLIICYISIILGDILIYSIGRKYGTALFKQRWFRKRVPPAKIKLAREKLENSSILMIFVARHLFYLRTVTFLTCGAVKMKFAKFIISDAIAALISTPLVLGVGYVAAEHYHAILARLSKYQSLVGGILLVIGLCYYLYQKRKPVTASTEDAEEIEEESLQGSAGEVDQIKK